MTISDSNLSSSPISLDGLSDDVVLNSVNLDEYQQVMFFFQQSLYRLNKSLFIVDCIEKFPFDLLTSTHDRIFLNQVVTVFLDDALLTVYKLVVDTDISYTLQEFKNKISPENQHKQGFIKDEFRNLFNKRIASLYFDRKTQFIRTCINDLRNDRIAHHTRNWVLGNSDVEKLELPKFKELITATESLFHALCFNTYRLLLPPEYINSKSDIEKILDSLAKESYLLNLPEHESYSGEWEWRRQNLSANEIEQLNYYRKKFGLSEI